MNKTNRLICLFILLVTMLAVPTMQASAALATCRTDPIFLLSNGDSVTVTLDIGTDASNVSNIHYILHVPAGVTVIRVAYTAVRQITSETYKVYQDSPAKTYTTDTVVTTQTSGKVAVTVNARLNGVFMKSVSGYSGQHLVITINGLLTNTSALIQ